MPISNNKTKASEIGQTLANKALEATKHRHHRWLIAEGDSWFKTDYHPDLIDALDDLKDSKGKYFRVENVANRGDTLQAIATSEKQAREFARKLQSMIDEKKQPSAILLSAGGNDMVDEETLERMIKRGNGQPKLEDQEVQQLMGELHYYFLIVVYRMNGVTKKLLKKQLPILIHGYCAGVPDGRRFKGIWELVFGRVGPWLKPTFDRLGYTNVSHNADVVKELLCNFNSMLKQLSEDVDNVHHVNLQGILESNPDMDYKVDWNDEMHPTEPGYKKLASEMAKKLRELESAGKLD